MVNLATDLKDSWLAWVGVVVLMVLTGGVASSPSTFRRVTRRDRKRHPGNTTRQATSQRCPDQSAFRSDRIQGNVHIHQAGRRTYVAEITAVAMLAVVLTYLNRDERTTAQNPNLAEP